jgi:hypothetical protein
LKIIALLPAGTVSHPFSPIPAAVVSFFPETELKFFFSADGVQRPFLQSNAASPPVGAMLQAFANPKVWSLSHNQRARQWYPAWPQTVAYRGVHPFLSKCVDRGAQQTIKSVVCVYYQTLPGAVVACLPVGR